MIHQMHCLLLPFAGREVTSGMYELAGSFSFPSVPPDSNLTYEVELLQYDPVMEVETLLHLAV